MMKKHLSYLIVSLSILYGCQTGKKGPDVRHIEAPFSLHHFYKDLQNIPIDSVDKYVPILKNRYGTYLDAISQGVLKIGSTKEKQYPAHLKAFLAYDANRDVFAKIDSVYPNTKRIKQELELAFKHYKHYFPNQSIPDVYLHISGFNQSVVVDSGWISVSLEKYLGADCQFYTWLNYYQYLKRRMVPEKVVPDIMKALAMTNHNPNLTKNNLLNNIVQEGKVLFYVNQMCPQLEDSLLLDMSQEQLKWCKNYESDIWGFMVENQHLFSTDRMVIQKYIGDSPFTSYFGKDSPGKVGSYIGYQIIKSYMQNNPDVSLQALMLPTDGQQILSASRYSP
jgi:hypothetical protein